MTWITSTGVSSWSDLCHKENTFPVKETCSLCDTNHFNFFETFLQSWFLNKTIVKQKTSFFEDLYLTKWGEKSVLFVDSSRVQQHLIIICTCTCYIHIYALDIIYTYIYIHELWYMYVHFTYICIHSLLYIYTDYEICTLIIAYIHYLWYIYLLYIYLHVTSIYIYIHIYTPIIIYTYIYIH